MEEVGLLGCFLFIIAAGYIAVKLLDAFLALQADTFCDIIAAHEAESQDPQQTVAHPPKVP